jgi:hypothetical protein
MRRTRKRARSVIVRGDSMGRTVFVGFAALLLSWQVAAQERPRVFVPESSSWAAAGAFAGSQSKGGAGSRAGARPQTAEIIKTVGERCPQAVVTMKQEGAHYVLLLEHEGGKGAMRRDNKFAVFNRDGDVLKSGSTRTLGNAVKDACAALMQDWAARAK